jgi:exodeoxyribonuclease-3
MLFMAATQRAEESRALRLFTLNVSGPSIERASRILEYLSRLDPDVIVLTETRGAPGTRLLLEAFRSSGYTVIAPSDQLIGERGVAIIHRVRSVVVTHDVHTPDLAYRLLITQLGDQAPMALVGAYVPSRDASAEKIERKRSFLNQMVDLLRTLSAHEDIVLMGDFNIVDRSHVPRYSSFRSWEYEALAAIRECGLVEAFSELYPDSTAYSWYGRTGDGYRYDYGFVSRSLVGRLHDCEYVDMPRTLGISDHSGLLMTIEPCGTGVLRVATPRAERQAVLL